MGKKKNNAATGWSNVPTKQQQQQSLKIVVDEKKERKKEQKRIQKRYDDRSARDTVMFEGMCEWDCFYNIPIGLAIKEATDRKIWADNYWAEVRAENKQKGYSFDYIPKPKKVPMIPPGMDLATLRLPHDPAGHLWQWRFRDPKAARGDPTQQKGMLKDEQIALTQSDGMSLMAFLRHYPRIVFMGFSFWRKMLIMLGDTDEVHHMTQEDRSCFPPLLHPSLSRAGGAGEAILPRSDAPKNRSDRPNASTRARQLMLKDARVASQDPFGGHEGVKGNLKYVLNKIPAEILARGTTSLDTERNTIYYITSFFYWAIHAGQNDVVSLISENFKLDLNYECGEWEYRWDWCAPLSVAVSGGRHAIIRMMVLKYGADLTYTGMHGFSTHLHSADFDTARMLLVECKIDPDIEPSGVFDNDKKGTPLQSKLNSLISDTISLISDTFEGSDRRKQENDQRESSLKFVKLFLENGARTDVFNQRGDYPLHQAARVHPDLGGVELVQELLSAGAKADQKQEQEEGGSSGAEWMMMTAFEVATESGHHQAAKVLKAASK